MISNLFNNKLTIEVGRTRAAGYAAKLMSDAGSDVITIQDVGREKNMTSYARMYMDTGKDVITWNAETDTILATKVLPHANAFITDLPQSELKKRGLDFERVHAIAPKLNYVSLTPTGWGDDQEQIQGELSMQALSGLMYMVGHQDREPLALPYGIGAVQLGLQGAAAITAAIYETEINGRGHYIEISGTQVLASYVRIYGAVASYYDIQLRREGRRAPGSGGRYPFGLFPCKDGYVAMICRSDREWQSLLQMMGNPEWSKQDRYLDLYAIAIEYPEEIDELIRPWLMNHTRDELLELAQKYAVPVAPVRNVKEVTEDKQLLYRSFFDQLTTKNGRVVQIPGRPWASVSRELQEFSPQDTANLIRKIDVVGVNVRND
ncbi:CoA transferase [Bacillus sp. 1P02SD]|uniref:CoA transferase n=1 Tax=Bacillus sp. 1P02SD TaxID=3132264 RepID=UPI0039A25744